MCTSITNNIKHLLCISDLLLTSFHILATPWGWLGRESSWYPPCTEVVRCHRQSQRIHNGKYGQFQSNKTLNTVKAYFFFNMEGEKCPNGFLLNAKKSISLCIFFNLIQGPVAYSDIATRERLDRPMVKVFQRHPGTQLPEAQEIIRVRVVTIIKQ